jgi:histidinol-phosphate phosphatase family protein
VGIITNQSGVARGLMRSQDVDRVNGRIEQHLGRFDVIAVCAHGPDDGCGCRKPAPGLIHRAARVLGVDPARCVVIGDIGSDVDAALAAGATAVLVPTPTTLRDEVSSAPAVAGDLATAVDLVLAGLP